MKQKYTDVNTYISDLIQEIVSKVTTHTNASCISSIIVTGSFGRNEPTFEKDEKGYLTLKSDVEIALVYDKFKNKGKVLRLMQDTEKCFSELVEFMPFQKQRIIKAQNHNFAIVEPKYKSLFTYDIFNGSYTAWGTDYLHLKQVPLDQVDPFEAKRIVGNRIGELMCFLNRGSAQYDNNYKKLWKAKVMLAIVSAYLLCNKMYISSYHKQRDRIIQPREMVIDIFGEKFLSDYEKAFSYLRENGESCEILDENLRKYVAAINTVLQKKGITKARINCLSKKMRSWIHYLKCGSNYGFNFENNLYQNLINAYIENADCIQKLADDWRKILYY